LKEGLSKRNGRHAAGPSLPPRRGLPGPPPSQHAARDLNESLRRGHSVRPCPLRPCVGASNVLPDDDSRRVRRPFPGEVFVIPSRIRTRSCSTEAGSSRRTHPAAPRP
jgi:hypothetical protein